jgi:hypothetical protein
MRLLSLVVAGLLLALPAFAAQPPAATPQIRQPFRSLESTVAWINDYPRTRDVAHAPLAVRALSAHGGLRDAENAGLYVGFIAGLIGANPDRAETLIEKMLPVRSEDEWAVVRGIAYSGHPQWKDLLRKYSGRLSARQVMIDGYLKGRLPTLGALAITPSPTTWQRIGNAFAIDWPGAKKKNGPPVLEPSQPVLDTLWGYYLASDSYGPLLRIVELTVWSKDRDNLDRLTVGSMAKYTLAANSLRDRQLLEKLKTIRSAKSQTKEISSQLDAVVKAAETADTGKLRKEALASIEQLKTKGPAYKRDVNTWAKVGQGALAVGCVAAAFTGHVELGLPCVIGGGATSAAMYYVNE